MKIETIVVHCGQKPDPTTGAIATPITTAINGTFRALEYPIGIEYARTRNPIRGTLEHLIAELCIKARVKIP